MSYSADQIAKWFLCKNKITESDEGGELISNLKLQKLLYYAQGCYLALKDIPLFNDNIVAWTHGPVVESIYHEYKCFGSNGIDIEIDFNVNEIDKDTSSILEEVYQTFGQYSAWKLRNMTHEEAPWIETPKDNIISQESIKAYFKNNYIES